MNSHVDSPLAIEQATAFSDASRYDEAIATLEGIPDDDELYAEAQSMLAQLKWVLSDDEGALAHAEVSLALPEAPRRAETIRDRLVEGAFDDPTTTSALTPAGYSFTHAAFYVGPKGNFGDTVLPWSVRRVVERQAPVAQWNPLHVHRLVGPEIQERINASDGLIIGGGGLFLPDTMANANSGWQWNIAGDTLRGITAPIAVTAVGLNLFPGQEFEGNTFSKSLHALAETATVIGLRNTGSVGRIRDMLPDDLAAKVKFLPCPTVLNGMLMPTIAGLGELPTSRVVHLNAAFDRGERRFGDDYRGFLAQLAAFITALPDDVEVRCAAHLKADEKIATDLARSHGIDLPIDRLYLMTATEGLELYAASSLVIGMRGHASMLPFGVGTPIISLVSHPKLQYFLDDIGHSDWGVSVHDPLLGDKLRELSIEILDNQRVFRDQVTDAQLALDRITRDTLADFTAALPTTPAQDVAFANLEQSRAPRVSIVAAFDNAANWAAPVVDELAARSASVRFFTPTDERSSLSRAQLDRIASYPITHAPLADIATQLVRTSDVVIAQLAGSVAAELTTHLHAKTPEGALPPVIAGGFFGVVANNAHAGYEDRLGFDVLSLNTDIDRELFSGLADAFGIGTDNLLVSGLALLPGQPAPQKTGAIRRVLFTDQPTVPHSATERLYVYSKVAEYAAAHPDREVAIKPRHRPGEDTFHTMQHSPEELLAQLDVPDNLVLNYASIAEQVDEIDLVITVSSTAALEALGHGCRVALVADLGVRQDLMNPVFLESGLLRTFDEITADAIGAPSAEWLAGYFPSAAGATPATTLVDRILELVESGERPGYAIARGPFVTHRRKVQAELNAITAKLTE